MASLRMSWLGLAMLVLVCASSATGISTASSSSTRRSTSVVDVDLDPSQIEIFQEAIVDMPFMSSIWGDNETMVNACREQSSPSGVYECDNNGFVTEFRLYPSDYMRFPTAFSKLTNLTYLRIEGDYVGGTLPTQWSSLTKLTTLRIRDYDGNLTGAIPNQWSAMQSLEEIRVYFNSELVSNQTIAPVPTWLGTLKNLTYMRLEGMNFGVSTSLPSSWFTSSSILSMRIEDCICKVVIPNGITNNVLQTLSIGTYNGKADVALPSDLSGFKSLSSLTLGTQNVGPLPQKWPPALESIYLYNMEYLTGSIPNSLMSLPSLTDADFEDLPKVGGNMPVPTSANTSELRYVYFYNIGFTGPFSSVWFSIPKLYALNIANCNKMKPSSLGDLSDVTAGGCQDMYTLTIANSSISGTIPSNLTSVCPILTDIFLHNNYITGSLPAEIVTGALYHLDISNNFLTGQLPAIASFNSTSRSATINLSNNRLSGTIPSVWVINPFFRVSIANNAIDICANASTLAQSLQLSSAQPPFFNSQGWPIGPQSVEYCSCSSIWAADGTTAASGYDTDCDAPSAPVYTQSPYALPPYVDGDDKVPPTTPNRTPGNASSSMTMSVLCVMVALMLSFLVM